MTRIAFDAMGGDRGPGAALDGAEAALATRKGLSFTIFGPEPTLSPLLKARPRLEAASDLSHVDKIVRMDDKPSQAVRRGRGSSMWAALEAVAEGRATVAVSSGNTGALMAMATLRLRTMADVDRPAIAAFWPRLEGRTVVLDVGANLEATPKMLADWAILGEACARAVSGTARPKVALLNIGQEELKGHDEIRQAADMIRAAAPDIDFIGFVEGGDIATGMVDVVVTDGFTGNVALKTAEGTARLVGGFVRAAFTRSIGRKLAALVARPALADIKRRMDPSGVNGGVFLGLNGLVVKSHGGADAKGFASALLMAADLAESRFTEDILRNLAAMRGEAASSDADEARAS